MTAIRDRSAPAPPGPTASRGVVARGARPGAAVRLRPTGVGALQRSAGNAATVAVLQRLAGGEGTRPPAPVRTAPTEDPRFVAVAGAVRAHARTARSHPAPVAEARAAGAAAVPPSGERQSQAEAARADTMARARPGGFDKAAFVAAVRAAVAAQAPHNLDEAADFAGSGRAGAIRGQVVGHVTTGRQAAARDITDRTAAPPDPAAGVDKPVTPLVTRPGVAAPTVDTAHAVPAPAPAAQTDLEAPARETDHAMAEADVTPQQLATSNEPEFTDALAARQAGEQHSATAPAQVRASEARTLVGAAGGARASGQAGLAAMTGSHGRALGGAHAGQTAAQSRDEAARAQITTRIRELFDQTKTAVDATLAGIDTGVATRFDAGEREAHEAFTADHRARMAAYKDARYSGLAGAGRWVRDKFADLPPEANQIFEQARAGYEARMTRLVSSIADFIGAELSRAKDTIARGQQQIAAFVASKPRALQGVAREAQHEIGARFAELEADVDTKQQGLVSDLAGRYSSARTAIDEEITAAQEANRGLWNRAKDAIGGAIRTIMQLKDMLLGVLTRAAGAVGRIIRDPIGFLGNLVGAVRGGIEGFLANIGTHLRRGLQSWLLGALGEAGIQLPERFDLRGIITLVLSLLGLTWANIRARIVRQIPESVMSGVEQAVDFIRVISAEGVGGLWRWVVEKVDSIEEMVIGQIHEFVRERIVRAGITWLISMLNPAAAFIRACRMIVDVVTFFVERAQQIKAFVDSILDSVESIASGGRGAVAGYIERTLGNMVPLLIGFLANLLGLGGISEKIREVLASVQRPITRVVDSLIARAVRVGRGLLRRITGRRRGGEPAAVAPGSHATEGAIVASSSTSAAGRPYTGQAVITRGRLEVVIQRNAVNGVNFARLSARNAKLPVREQINRLVTSLRSLESRGIPGSPEQVDRLNTLLRRAMQEDLVAAATAFAAANASELSAHVAEFHALTALGARRDAYYMEHVGWQTLANRVRARDLARIGAEVRSVSQSWTAGEEHLHDLVLSLHTDLRLGSDDTGDPVRPGKPKYVPPEALQAFIQQAEVITTSDRGSRGVDRARRASAVDAFINRIRAGRFDVDHRTSLAAHWQSEGHRATAEVRAMIASDPNNLVLVSASWNRSKGAEGESYGSAPSAGFTRHVGEAPSGANSPTGLFVPAG